MRFRKQNGIVDSQARSTSGLPFLAVGSGSSGALIRDFDPWPSGLQDIRLASCLPSLPQRASILPAERKRRWPCASTTLQNHQARTRDGRLTLLTPHRALDCRCVHQSKICQSSDPRSCSGSVGEKGGCLKFDIYKNLLRINAGYKEVIRGLAGLRKQRAFPRGELDRFSALSKENRAATNSLS